MKTSALLILIQFFIISIILFIGIFHEFNYAEHEKIIIKKISRNWSKDLSIIFTIIINLLFLINFLSKYKKIKNEIFIFIMFLIFIIYNSLILIFISAIRMFVGFKLQIILFSIVALIGLISTIYLIYKFNQL